MFSGCSSLASLDVSGWDTSKVTNMAGMFEGCSSLASLDLSGWDTSGAESMVYMFDGCPSLSSVTLGEKFSFKARSDARYYAVLPDAPDDEAHTGRWVNSSAPGAQGVTAAELRDGYPNAGDPSYAPGTYVWEAATDISAAKVTAPDQTYTGAALTPAPTVALNGKTLAAGADYTVSYKNNVNAGTATVTVTGKGNYEGSASGTFRIDEADISKREGDAAEASYAYDGRRRSPAVKSPQRQDAEGRHRLHGVLREQRERRHGDRDRHRQGQLHRHREGDVHDKEGLHRQGQGDARQEEIRIQRQSEETQGEVGQAERQETESRQRLQGEPQEQQEAWQGTVTSPARATTRAPLRPRSRSRRPHLQGQGEARETAAYDGKAKSR